MDFLNQPDHRPASPPQMEGLKDQIGIYYSVQTPHGLHHFLSPFSVSSILFLAPSSLPLIPPASYQIPSPILPLSSIITHP